MFVMAKIFEELFILTWNRIGVRYVFSMEVVLGAMLNDLLWRIQTKQHDDMQRNPKKMTPSLKLSIDTAIQSQA